MQQIMAPELLNIIDLPTQYKGKEIIAESEQTCASEAAADTLFRKALRKLKDVNNWHKFVTKPFAVFRLTSADGTALSAPSPEPGMRFKIDISGPGSDAGDGYDWAEVKSVEDFHHQHYEGCCITVCPTDNPLSSKHNTAHFYDETSSSTFIVAKCKTKNSVCALVVDRNIEVNHDNDSVVDSVRNNIVGVMGKIAFSKMQWELLANALLQP
jgi:hypothetical protein